MELINLLLFADDSHKPLGSASCVASGRHQNTVVLRRHHHDYGILMALHSPELLEQSEAVLFAHEDVQKDQIGAVILKVLQGFRRGLERFQVHIEGLDAEFIQVNRRGAIVDDDDFWDISWHRGPTNFIIGRPYQPAYLPSNP